MKNVLVISIALFLVIFTLSMCNCDFNPSEATSIIHFSNSVDFHLRDNGTELDVKLDFQSKFSDNAFLILLVGKEYPTYTEGFKDSLKIKGFSIRSYSLSYDYCINDAGSPFDYPLYIKTISIKRGQNKESFKIVFPRNIASISEVICVEVTVV